MNSIEELIKAYESDANSPEGLGRFEVLNMLTNRDVIEEHRGELTTLQSARLLFADEKLMASIDVIITECGGKSDFLKLRQHDPAPSAWWWYLEQIPIEQLA